MITASIVPDEDERCPLMSRISNSLREVTLDVTEFSRLGTIYNLEPGGAWHPKHCHSLHHVAIIVSYRNRPDHLKTFLVNLHPFLQRQNLSYQIFVVEQNLPQKFNRAKLFNIGYVEAQKLSQFKCVIFHDIDLIPENPNNIYACTKKPRHMSSSIDIYDYQNLYFRLFGGAVAILQEQFEKVNGFPNCYFGWGGEDDDFYERVTSLYRICRFEDYVSRYKMLNHKKDTREDEILELLSSSSSRRKTDGLNSLNYSLLSFDLFDSYTRIWVNL